MFDNPSAVIWFRTICACRIGSSDRFDVLAPDAPRFAPPPDDPYSMSRSAASHWNPFTRCAVSGDKRSGSWIGTKSKGTGSNSRAELRRSGGGSPTRNQWAARPLEGKIQERYGLAKDQAKKDVEAWFNTLP
jgi:hypothetical protein